MRNVKRMLSLAAVSVVVLAATTALYAKDSDGSFGSTMRDGMMGMGQMMGRAVSAMMGRCSGMMQGSGSERPNEQWRNGAPTTKQ